MKSGIVASLDNLILKNDKSIDLTEYTISGNKDILRNNFIDIPFVAALGEFNLEKLTNNPFIYRIGPLSDFFNLHKVTTPAGLIRKVNSSLNAIIHCLWFLKDNSVTLSTTYSNFDNAMLGPMYCSFNHSYSDSTGRIVNTSFTDAELFEFNPIWNVVLYNLTLNIDFDNIADRSLMTGVNLSKFNRIHRALYFLEDARKAFFLPLKITNYMALYESLFSIQGEDKITHKLCKRASNFLSGSSQDISSNYRKLEEAYNVRSRYMHGNKIQYSQADLERISKDVDSLTRPIILSAIVDYYEIFSIDDSVPAQNAKFKTFATALSIGNQSTISSYKSRSRISKQSISISIKSNNRY